MYLNSLSLFPPFNFSNRSQALSWEGQDRMQSWVSCLTIPFLALVHCFKPHGGHRLGQGWSSSKRDVNGEGICLEICFLGPGAEK